MDNNETAKSYKGQQHFCKFHFRKENVMIAVLDSNTKIFEMVVTIYSFFHINSLHLLRVKNFQNRAQQFVLWPNSTRGYYGMNNSG